jgi:excisionase family DNA binding protein
MRRATAHVKRGESNEEGGHFEPEWDESPLKTVPISATVYRGARGALPLLTVAQLADQLGVSRSWVYAKVEAGELPYLRIGRYVRFATQAVDTYLEAQRRGLGV